MRRVHSEYAEAIRAHHKYSQTPRVYECNIIPISAAHEVAMRTLREASRSIYASIRTPTHSKRRATHLRYRTRTTGRRSDACTTARRGWIAAAADAEARAEDVVAQLPPAPNRHRRPDTSSHAIHRFVNANGQQTCVNEHDLQCSWSKYAQRASSGGWRSEV